MWVRKRIDIGWWDLTRAAGSCLIGGESAPGRDGMQASWGRTGRVPLVSLSVRSGFDALLSSMKLEPGDEVAMSALTIPDMPKIVREHSLVPVPIDVEPVSMNVDVERLEAALSPRTKAVVIAHLFGGRVHLEPLAELCRRRGIVLIEDCAQAFIGWDFVGSPGADVSMFSFGPIKTHTSLIGSVFTFRDEEMAAKVDAIQKTWRRHRPMTFCKRSIKYGFVKLLSVGWIAGSVATALRLMGRDHDRLATNMARGFAGGDFFEKIRQQPCAAIERTLSRRFSRFEPTAVERRRRLGKLFLEGVGENVVVLGATAEDPSFWVLPILVGNPQALVKTLWKHGFDATCSSSLQAIPAPEDRPELDAAVGKATLASTVFLPFYPRMSERVVERMAGLVRSHAQPMELKERRRVLERPARFSRSLSLTRSS